LFPVPDRYECEICTRPGAVAFERSHSRGDGTTYSRVQVRYAYDPERCRFTRSHVAREPGLLCDQNVYVFTSPFITDGETARDVAEMLLDVLNEPTRSKRPALVGGVESALQLRNQGWQVAG
jgi:hypothetical protein